MSFLEICEDGFLVGACKQPIMGTNSYPSEKGQVHQGYNFPPLSITFTTNITSPLLRGSTSEFFTTSLLSTPWVIVEYIRWHYVGLLLRFRIGQRAFNTQSRRFPRSEAYVLHFVRRITWRLSCWQACRINVMTSSTIPGSYMVTRFRGDAFIVEKNVLMYFGTSKER